MRDLSLINPDHPRMVPAVAELSDLIRARFPDAEIAVYTSYEPVLGVALAVRADAELDDVMDVVIDRMVDMQVEEGLPIHVFFRGPQRSAPKAQATTGEGVLLPTAH